MSRTKPEEEEQQGSNKSLKIKKKKVIGQPVESFSNNVAIDRTIKQACSIRWRPGARLSADVFAASYRLRQVASGRVYH